MSCFGLRYTSPLAFPPCTNHTHKNTHTLRGLNLHLGLAKRNRRSGIHTQIDDTYGAACVTLVSMLSKPPFSPAPSSLKPPHTYTSIYRAISSHPLHTTGKARALSCTHAAKRVQGTSDDQHSNDSETLEKGAHVHVYIVPVSSTCDAHIACTVRRETRRLTSITLVFY